MYVLDMNIALVSYFNFDELFWKYVNIANYY